MKQEQKITLGLSIHVRMLVLSIFAGIGTAQIAIAASADFPVSPAIQEMIKQQKRSQRKGLPNKLFCFNNVALVNQMVTCPSPRDTSRFLEQARAEQKPLLVAVVQNTQTGSPLYFEAHSLNEQFLGYPLVVPTTSLRQELPANLQVFNGLAPVSLSEIVYYRAHPITKRLTQICTAEELMSLTPRGQQLRDEFYNNWLDPFFAGRMYFWGEGKDPQDFTKAQHYFEAVLKTSSHKIIREEAQWYLTCINTLGLLNQAPIATAADAQRFLKYLTAFNSNGNRSTEALKQLLIGKLYAKLNDKEHAINALENVIQSSEGKACAMANRALAYLDDTLGKRTAHLQAAQKQQASLPESLAAATPLQLPSREDHKLFCEQILAFYRNTQHERNPLVAEAELAENTMAIAHNALLANPRITNAEIVDQLRRIPMLNRSPYPFSPNGYIYLVYQGVEDFYLHKYESARYFLEEFLAAPVPAAAADAPTPEQLFLAHAYLGLMYREGYGVFKDIKQANKHFAQATSAKYPAKLPFEQDKLTRRIFGNWQDGTLENLNNPENLKSFFERFQTKVNRFGQTCGKGFMNAVHFTLGTPRRRKTTCSLLVACLGAALIARKTTWFQQLGHKLLPLRIAQPLGVRI